MKLKAVGKSNTVRQDNPTVLVVARRGLASGYRMGFWYGDLRDLSERERLRSGWAKAWSAPNLSGEHGDPTEEEWVFVDERRRELSGSSAGLASLDFWAESDG